MKKVLSGLTLISLLAVPVLVLGQVGEEPPAGRGAPTETIKTGQDLINLIDNIGQWMFVILMALAGIFLIVAGWNFITSSGQAEKVTTATNMLRNALIGVAIALGSKGLVAVVKSLLGA